MKEAKDLFISLRREAVSGLGIGSSSPALGRKIVCTLHVVWECDVGIEGIDEWDGVFNAFRRWYVGCEWSGVFVGIPFFACDQVVGQVEDDVGELRELCWCWEGAKR
mmetsp:Transcript_14768/g.31874  ORF Transcript_14768/g.31874 Transcript_14768/m.31874 type:complete len:107 (-) Transcript_14768:480-800(-)